MAAAVRCGTFLGLLVFSIACGNADRPTAPSSLPTQVPSTGPGDIYLFSGPLSNPVSDSTMLSKYVLYESGAFSLQYPWAELVGTYRLENGRISFRFGAGGDGTTGTLNGDLLEVRYGGRMEEADFENAVYRRSH